MASKTMFLNLRFLKRLLHIAFHSMNFLSASMAAAADDTRILRAEVDLLAEYASGEKRVAQVRKDA